MRSRVLFLFAALVLTALSAAAQGTGDPARGLTTDFRNWLTANGYGGYHFERSDVAGGSYGGRTVAGQAVVNQPVIFIHGNSDSALGTSSPYTGWYNSIAYFKGQGYTSAELYATTWGPADPFQASLQYHSKETMVNRIRAFIQAVKAYTGATKVDVVTHSMGVTLARKAIKGGSAYDSAAGGTYSLGSSLTSSVDTFVGISGANQGLVACYNSGPTTPTCSDVNGLYPGYFVGAFGPYDVSSILVDMNSTSHYEGSFVYTIWSTVDEVIGYGDVVWGQYTSRIPGQNGEVVFGSAPYGHFGCKDQTGYTQWRMVKYHATN
jgi:triacylglycerol esterase/lipase EstA (alpha/beta hydrolase family)